MVLCGTLAGSQAAELLNQVAPDRTVALRDAALNFSNLPRSQRLASFARFFTPTHSATSIDNLKRRLEHEPAWYSGAVLRSVAPEIRGQLLSSKRCADAWRQSQNPHPAILDHSRRFSIRTTCG